MNKITNTSMENVIRVQASELLGDRAAEIASKFEDGHMILVLNEHCDASVAKNIVSVFGYGTLATCSLFAMSTTGMLVDAADLSDMQPSSIDKWLDGAVARIQATSFEGVSISAANSVGQQPDAMAPRMRITASGVGPNNFAYTSELIVMRDAQPASDKKVVLARTQFDIKPDLKRGFRIQEFSVASSIRSGSNTGFTRLDHEPKSDGRTDFTIEKVHEKTVGYSFTAGLSVGGGVSSTGPTLSAKSAFSFGYNRSRTDRQGISYAVKDYRVESNPILRPDGTNLVELRSIRDRRAAAATPMGSVQHLQQLVRWEIDASYKDVAAFRVVLQRLDIRSILGTPGEGGQNFSFTAPAVFVPMNSPFITRSPTVLIQSTHLTGHVLGAQPNGRGVQLVKAERPETNTAIQWEFDAESRYINRLTGTALTMDPTSGALSLQKPTLDLTQRWEWRADRLHSQYSDRVFRLTNERGRPTAARSQDLPLNDENSLLAPWGQYPGKPAVGDTIPRSGPGLTRPPIPPAWPEQFDAVPETERWQLVILRAGIGNS
ncbi:hypothetical protein [Dyella sp.]|jgi:hypothetical protein|uniref:hypothetical protein n=1 Tax=Dyella sp. TaxID=1869338 RepID=UPI002FD91462